MQGDDAQLQRIRRQLGQRVGDFECEALFTEAADDSENAVGHEVSLVSWRGATTPGASLTFLRPTPSKRPCRHTSPGFPIPLRSAAIDCTWRCDRSAPANRS